MKTVFLLCLNKILKKERKKKSPKIWACGAEAAEQWSEGVTHTGVQGHPQPSWNGTRLARRDITSYEQWIFEYDPETEH